MKPLAILSAAAIVTLNAISCAQKSEISVTLPETDSTIVQPLRLSDDASPATQPALPEGHPAIGGMPAGHPPIGDGAPAPAKPAGVPAGHPDISQMGGGGKPGMPAGHPEIPQAAHCSINL